MKLSDIIKHLKVELPKYTDDIGGRIFPCFNVNFAGDSYTKMQSQDIVLYLSYSDTSTTKKNQDSDIIYRYFGGRYRQEIIQTLDTYLFYVKKNNPSGLSYFDFVEDFRLKLIKSLCGLGDVNTGKFVYLNDGFIDSFGSFAVHRFSFQNYFEISEDDIYIKDDSVPMQSIEINYNDDESTKKQDSLILE